LPVALKAVVWLLVDLRFWFKRTRGWRSQVIIFRTEAQIQVNMLDEELATC